GQAQARLIDATTGERLEENRQAERFEVIEQATRPETPITSSRRKIVLAGAGGGLAVGFAAVVLLELLDRSIRTVADIEKRLQIRPIASIPYVQTTSEKRRRRRRTILLWLFAILSVVVALALVHWFYLPLDLLVKNVPLPF
ncbi:MAG: lipopolysaccharide biosynthesis protein, partial [bacterium]|nr:lipopolysaccharide biosynthesis protein [bacterium]